MQQFLSLDLEDALTIVDLIRREALRDGGNPVCIVVSDVAGRPLALETMDGCPPASITVALAKVHTVCQSGGKPTMDYADRPGFDPANWADPGMTTFGGGVPVFHEGQFVGAVGVSGRKPEEDQDLAKSGVAGWERG